ncbi:hypothetical protein JCGZ_23274 [Jatropha curcas]|uniref:Pectinesterase n=1 Tax=Jatropha curcas TaxID=180498 RepID=A0A067JHL9_JATCU|nr:pectinesterase [Jatropha curcas]KDP23441.1 hypothetical protein JCGZ_23274 [Jatropha curcas]
MASHLSTFCKFPFLFLLFSPSLANFLTSTSTPTGTTESFCNSTPYPYFCKSFLLPFNKSGNIHDYSRISIRQTLSHGRKFLSLVKYLLKLNPTSFSSTTVLALQDCQFLAQLNVDSLSYTLGLINSTNTLPSLQAVDLQTLLSATLTNLQTCLDGVQASKSGSTSLSSLLAPISNGTKHCSVSLAFFTHGWINSGKKKGRILSERKHVFSDIKNGIKDGLPLKMSNKDQEIYESFNKRKLLQTTGITSVKLLQTTGITSVLVNQMVVVSKKLGIGNFTSINDAVSAAPNNTANTGSGYFVIYVVKGVYQEYVSIPSNKQNIMIIGDGIGKTVITGNRSVIDGWTTFNSATFAVVGQGFVAVNITFRNTAGAIKHQAVAVRNGADMSAFYRCSFEGYQDTLYAHSLRQFYRDCEIYGTIDYIFGNAAVVFQNCKISSRLPLNFQYNTITAQGRTDPNQNTGISIQNCSIKAAKDLATSNVTIRTYLGRPWKEYSRTIFMESYIASLIDPTGWAPWSGDFALSTLYYAEFNNSGVGSKTANRVTWSGYHLINATEAANFTVSNFTQGDVWLPATGISFTGGLLSTIS